MMKAEQPHSVPGLGQSGERGSQGGALSLGQGGQRGEASEILRIPPSAGAHRPPRAAAETGAPLRSLLLRNGPLYAAATVAGKWRREWAGMVPRCPPAWRGLQAERRACRRVLGPSGAGGGSPEWEAKGKP